MIAQIKYALQRHPLFLLPISLFLVYLPFSHLIDQTIASFFLGQSSKFTPPPIALFIYKYGLIPGQLLFLTATIVLITSFLSKKVSSLRLPSLYIMLTLFIGSALISNVLLKQYWTRPRPKQVFLYGGGYPYCPIFIKYTGKTNRPLRSLPCGHSTMGFCFFTLFFIGKRYKSKPLTVIGLCTGSLAGLVISYARMAQGGHFFSDVVLSFLIMWLTAYFLDRLVFRCLSMGEALLPQNTVKED